MHARIIKAVIKEKHYDAGWKLLQLEENKKFELNYKIEGKLITFYLVDISPITVNDL